MYKQLELTKLTLVILVKNYNPFLLNPGFLKYSDIVPHHWQLAEQPILSQKDSQIVYSNGVNIIAKPNCLIFAENLAGVLPDNVNSSQIACRYIETLSQLDYRAIATNFRGYLILNDKTDSEYLFKNNISDSHVRQLSNPNLKPTLNFTYNFLDSCLNLEILRGYLQLPESKSANILLFNGNFVRELKEEKATNKYKKIQEVFANWQADFEIYQNVVNKLIQPTKYST